MRSFRLVMLVLGNWVDNGKNLSCKSPSFHLFFALVAFSFHHFSSLYLLILLNFWPDSFFEFFLWNFNFHMHFIQANSLVLELFCLCFFFLRLGIVQCFVFLGFLSLLENFGLATPIPVGIRVLGVKTPLRA